VSNTEDDVQSGETTAAELPEEDGPQAPETTYQRFDCTSGEASQLFRAADAARQAVEHGQCIVMPTDTVYGIGADAFSPAAVQRLLDAKVRGRDMPPPVLIADPSLIRVLAVDVPQAAKDLVDRHWPGPLTVICRAQPSLRLDLGEADGTIALRVPDHDLAREILRQTGPMAVSSANISGLPAAVTCDEAVEQLGESVSVYLDGGRLGTGDALPSTIVDFTQSDFGAVLRHGALSVELLRETCADLEDLVDPDEELDGTPPDPDPEPTGPQSDDEEPVESQPEESDSADIRSEDLQSEDVQSEEAQIQEAEPDTRDGEPELDDSPEPERKPGV
jgi:L-threonylcarbamoyladenylate synthase